mgnify:CR=1 FL=1
MNNYREIVTKAVVSKGKKLFTSTNSVTVNNPSTILGCWVINHNFNGVKNNQTPIIVERIVNDIDDIVKIVRFPDWQETTAGKQEIKKALRSIIWMKYKIKDKDVFDKAYDYIEQYY